MDRVALGVLVVFAVIAGVLAVRARLHAPPPVDLDRLRAAGVLEVDLADRTTPEP